MIEKLSKVQQGARKNSSLLVTLPKIHCEILGIEKGSTISFSLAKTNNENVIVLKKVNVQPEESHNLKVNVVA
jgi:alpha-L-arabinofuranosidase